MRSMKLKLDVCLEEEFPQEPDSLVVDESATLKDSDEDQIYSENSSGAVFA